MHTPLPLPLKKEIALFEASSQVKIWAEPELSAGAWVLVLLKAHVQLGQVIALHGLLKEADNSGRQEPDLDKPEGRASYCFPWAGLGNHPHSHPLILAVMPCWPSFLH